MFSKELVFWAQPWKEPFEALYNVFYFVGAAPAMQVMLLR